MTRRDSLRRCGIRRFSSGTRNGNYNRLFSSVAHLLALIASLLLVVSCGGGGTGDEPASRSSEDTKPSIPPPTEVITFYSQEYKGDAFFFAIDRSAKMADSGELEKAKAELIKIIKAFRPEARFGIVFFDNGIKKFPINSRGAQANPAMKAAGINWTQAIPGGTGSCCQQGLIEALEFVNRGGAAHRVIIYVSDGSADCTGADEQTYLDQTLSVVKEQNLQKGVINVIGVGEIGTAQEDFLKSLSSMNGGRYFKSD